MIYVVSDLHGQCRLFEKLLKKINFSSNDTMYILGDVIDRGPQSVELLMFIMNSPNIFYCIGNHELMMYLYEKGENDIWTNPANGGIETQNQFQKLSKEQANNIKDYIFNNTYLQIETSVNEKQFLLSHSSFVKNKGTIKNWLNYHEDKSKYHWLHRTVWNSPWRFWEYEDKQTYNDGRIHIIGHVPVQSVRYDEDYLKLKRKLGHDLDVEKIECICDKLKEYKTKTIINIDGGCAYIGRKSFKNIGIICMELTTNTFTYVRG